MIRNLKLNVAINIKKINYKYIKWTIPKKFITTKEKP